MLLKIQLLAENVDELILQGYGWKVNVKSMTKEPKNHKALSIRVKLSSRVRVV